ncbi:MAG: SAM-dependent methyltransferase [Rhodocyclales bacterium GWA2_65_20]|nr:MAG: SAM-dependent methyltransferase [Rhodocyclales bacterium GWA2_65_20]
MIAQDISNAEFAQFQRLIYQIAGISLADSKKVLLVGRLGKRLRAHGLSSYAEYFKLISGGQDPAELQMMVELLTTNETYFFREEKHFDFLADHIAAKHPPGSSLDIWSAAASTGEEIYTISMTLADTLGINGTWSVMGSDINTQVLELARSGHYPMEKARGLPPEYLRKYCLKGVRQHEGTFLIAPELRRHTRFMQVNLNQPLPAAVGKFHVIFLRNVMIYFDNDTKRQVVDRLTNQLHPGGWFIVGHSESLNNLSDRLKPVQPTIYRLP